MAMYVTGNLNLFDQDSAKEYGYGSVREYYEDFLEQWYTDVKSDEDHVYILGNLSQYAPEAALKLISSLPGTKHLVSGPRDQVSPDTKRGWELASAYYDAFVYVNTAMRRRLHGHDAILSFYGPEADCWWAPRRADAYYITAWQDVTEDSSGTPWVGPNELSVSWATWSRLVPWEEVKEMTVGQYVAPHDIIN